MHSRTYRGWGVYLGVKEHSPAEREVYALAGEHRPPVCHLAQALPSMRQEVAGRGASLSLATAWSMSGISRARRVAPNMDFSLLAPCNIPACDNGASAK